MIDGVISIRDCIDIEDYPNENFVFVIAPFDKERTDVYSNIIKSVVERNGYKCKRADDFNTNTSKINEIVRYIWKAEFIIADLTGFKPNVMYELGFSHAMDKEVIMIYEENSDNNNETKFPFDIGHIDIIIYKGGTIGGVELHDRLQKTIEYVNGKIIKTVKSDIKDFYIKIEDNEFKQSIISNFEIRKAHFFP